jgi:FPC/CPF motif-containing protein YcgG
LNQVLKHHVITPAPLNGDINAVPKCISGAVVFSLENFFGRCRGHVRFGHARVSCRPVG